MDPQAEAAIAKPPYEPAEIVDYGDVTELTENDASGGIDSPGPGYS
jgi:hypothetical protein